MDTHTLEAKFARIGARLKVADGLVPRRAGGPVTLDVRSDRDGEFFEIARRSGAELDVLDVRAGDRHLLLLVRDGGEKHKFLCGHDERHWFVAAVPEAAGGVGSVTAAKESLKPDGVKWLQSRLRVKPKDRNRRKNAAFVRQGEWFFVPAPGLAVDGLLVLRDEPLSRGAGSKPHRAEFCSRTGGETVSVGPRHPNGVSAGRYNAVLSRNPKATGWGWVTMRRNPAVYVKGRIRHADHKTVVLHDWHRVLMNTENRSRAMRHIAFLD
ncbi:MAG TPA: hypothetical protein VF170_00775 [Planctomycetaceae bacterium]